MFIKKISAAILVISSLLFISSSITVRAQGNILPPASGTSKCAGQNATYCGDYTVNDFVVLAINIAKWIMGIVGSLSLVMFVYGGFMFLISGGSADNVNKAKKIIIAAIIGLIIVFSSYLIIKFVLETMGVSWSGQILNPTTFGK